MKFSSKTAFQIFILVTLCSGLLITFDHKGFATKLLNVNFFVLLVGVVSYIKEAK